MLTCAVASYNALVLLFIMADIPYFKAEHPRPVLFFFFLTLQKIQCFLLCMKKEKGVQASASISLYFGEWRC